MSEYTEYWMIHSGDIGATCAALTAAKATSVLLIDFDHPCRNDRERAFELWKVLPYHQQWAVLLSGNHEGESGPKLPKFECIAHLLIDEDVDRWRFAIGEGPQHIDLLFSDQPWGDRSDLDPKKDWARIERAKNLSEADLAFLEQCLGLPRAKFKDLLRMGKVFDFLKSVGLPNLHMFDQYQAYFPPEGYGRCMLWDEYEGMAD